jgi:hypothetical protein
LAFKSPSAPAGSVIATHVTISDCDNKTRSHTWHYVFASDLAQDFDLSLSDLHVRTGSYTFVAWEYGATTATKLEKDMDVISLKAGKDYGDVRFWRLSPTMTSTFAVVGEPNKYVGVAKQRFACFSQSSAKIEATVTGAPGEDVLIAVADAEQQLHTVQCKLSSDGKAQLTVQATQSANEFAAVCQ